MVNIPSRRRAEYYAALRAAQADTDLRPFIELLLELYATTRLRY